MNSESLIFGCDFMSQNQVIIDYSNKIVSLCSDLVRTQLINMTDKQHVARLSKSVCIPANSEQIVNIRCSPRFSDQDVLVEAMPCCQFKKFAIARTLCKTDKTCNTVARILNCEPTALVLARGTKIATVNSIDVAKTCETFSPQQAETSRSETKVGLNESKISAEQLEEFATDYGFQINPDLEADQRRELLILLYTYRSCFARNLKELRRYKNYELELTVKDSKPCYQRQYKLSQQDALECHKQITEMADCGIIEPSTTSKYQSAMFTVRKSSGARRAVLDLRVINKQMTENSRNIFVTVAGCDSATAFCSWSKRSFLFKFRSSVWISTNSTKTRPDQPSINKLL